MSGLKKDTRRRRWRAKQGAKYDSNIGHNRLCAACRDRESNRPSPPHFNSNFNTFFSQLPSLLFAVADKTYIQHTSEKSRFTLVLNHLNLTRRRHFSGVKFGGKIRSKKQHHLISIWRRPSAFHAYFFGLRVFPKKTVDCTHADSWRRGGEESDLIPAKQDQFGVPALGRPWAMLNREKLPIFLVVGGCLIAVGLQTDIGLLFGLFSRGVEVEGRKTRANPTENLTT